MKITKQTNHNECGICVINSLVEYFYHRSNKIQILNKAKLSSDGLTIYDFETLSNEFGLNAETYQLS
jgi:ABC-type bacteriocin/lantibiotic exporter with double-glycine peptidase domain